MSTPPAASAIAALVRVVGCWMAFTIGLMAAANELPATVNKVCPTGNRPLRTTGSAAARVGPRVAIIEPEGGHEHDLDTNVAIRPRVAHAEARGDGRHIAASSVATTSAVASTLARATHAVIPSFAATIADAPIALTHAPPGTRAFDRPPASYFPPHYNRPPPVSSVIAA